MSTQKNRELYTLGVYLSFLVHNMSNLLDTTADKD